MTETTYREIATDIAALGVIGVAGYLAVNAMSMPEYFATIVGAAVAYLFIKNSPNTV